MSTLLYTNFQNLLADNKSIDALIVSKDPAELRAALLKQDGHGNSLLHWAVYNDDAGAIAKLMGGAQSFPGLLLEMFRVEDNAGNIPLLLALSRDKVNATNLLLDKALESAELFGALTVENNFGVSVLEKIISNKKGDLIARIIEKADDLGKLSDVANFKNSDGQSILELAKDSGTRDIEAQINALSPLPVTDTHYFSWTIALATSAVVGASLSIAYYCNNRGVDKNILLVNGVVRTLKEVIDMSKSAPFPNAGDSKLAPTESFLESDGAPLVGDGINTWVGHE